MGMAKKIRTILLERDMTIKELAEKIGTNGNNLSNKLSRDNFSEKELRDIAEALDCDYDGIFTLRDSGKVVWWNNKDIFVWTLLTKDADDNEFTRVYRIYKIKCRVRKL